MEDKINITIQEGYTYLKEILFRNEQFDGVIVECTDIDKEDGINRL